jgi:hypothetical protein
MTHDDAIAEATRVAAAQGRSVEVWEHRLQGRWVWVSSPPVRASFWEPRLTVTPDGVVHDLTTGSVSVADVPVMAGAPAVMTDVFPPGASVQFASGRVVTWEAIRAAFDKAPHG